MILHVFVKSNTEIGHGKWIVRKITTGRKNSRGKRKEYGIICRNRKLSLLDHRVYAVEQ